MHKHKVLVIFGTRPEAIKMCPVITEIRKRKTIETVVCVTGQHKEMLQQVLDVFEVEPQYDLEIMKQGQTLFDITVLILERLKRVLEQEKPELVLVHGDTSTTFAASLACYYEQIPVGHVEAGLRTYNIYSPYPEEFNRQATGIIAKYHFAPTDLARNNLVKEGKNKEDIFVTGNTVIDALKTTVSDNYNHEELSWAADSRLILLTAHRRENWGEPLANIFRAVLKTVNEHNDVKVIYPAHKNPIVREMAEKILGNHERIHIIDPLDVIDFHNFIAKSYLIMTDSGGIQEEAPSFGKPVLVLRNETERPEGVNAGTLELVGTNENKVYRAVTELLDNMEIYERMSKAKNPYGDGRASIRIADIIEKELCI